MQFQENALTDGRSDGRIKGWTEGQTHPTLQDLSGYNQGSKNDKP